MKANLLKNVVVLCLTFIQLFCFSTVFAKSSGGAIAGGGGDSYEERVNEIRSDILNWLKKGGSQGLNLGSSLSSEEYISKMTKILAPQLVIVTFVEKDYESDEELQVSVGGVPKTCRGFLSKKDNRPHILCDLNRFKKTTESDQYRLIHHEYVGLVGVERNDGAASDYFISSQITSYLQRQTVLKLSIKKTTTIEDRVIPFVELRGSKYIKEGVYEVTLIARNMQDTSELKLIPYNETSWDRCDLSPAPLIFSEEVMEHKIYVGGNKNCDSHHPALFEDGIIEYKDGVIKTLGYQKFYYISDFDLKNVPNVKVITEIIKEVKGQKLSEYGHKLKTIRRTVKFTFSTSSEQLKNIRAVTFINGEEIVIDDSQKIADFVNTREIYLDFDFVQKTDVVGGVCLDKCYFDHEVVLKDYKAEGPISQKYSLGESVIHFISDDLKPVPRFILMRDAYPDSFN